MMTGKDNGVAARFKHLNECNIMLSMQCICHCLALTCTETGDDLKFISDFEVKMTQLWAFFKPFSKLNKVPCTECKEIS